MPNVEQPLRQRQTSIYEEEETKEQGVPLNETTSSSDDIKVPTNKYLEIYKEHLKPVLSSEEQSKVF